MMLLLPIGRDHPDMLDPLRPLLDLLASLEEVDLPPVGFLHPAHTAGGVSDVQRHHVHGDGNHLREASSSIRRVPPFSLRVGGISAREDALYLAVDDDLQLREVRRRAAEGSSRIARAPRDDPALAPDGADHFVPSIPLAYFTGRGDRARIIEAVEPHREIAVGEYPVARIGVGRILSEPQIPYPDVDVVAEIAL